jgi:hypothetical protein
MKDFATYLTNITGAFPNIVPQDCSGPGETDGTEVLADLLNDGIFGWIQALMSLNSTTPDGTAESSTASQIIYCILKLLMGKTIPMEWAQFDADSWNVSIYDQSITTKANSQALSFPIDSPLIIASPVNPSMLVGIIVYPGAARTGANRMRMDVIESGTSEVKTVVGSVYDNGTANEQTLSVTYTHDFTKRYKIEIYSGNTSKSYPDSVHYGLQYMDPPI